MNVAALLTGRGNSTLRDKNLLPILGRPTLYYCAEAALTSKKIQHYFVSSDCPKILEAAGSLGYQQIQRPGELALPTAQHVDTIVHALGVMSDSGVVPDVIVVLLANAPTVLTEWIDACLESLAADSEATAAVPVVKDQDHNPYRAKKLAIDGRLQPFVDVSGEAVSSNRQDLPESYFLSHNFWAIRLQEGKLFGQGDPPWSFMGDKVLPYLVDESVDIHEMEDLERAERWLRRHGVVDY